MKKYLALFLAITAMFCLLSTFVLADEVQAPTTPAGTGTPVPQGITLDASIVFAILFAAAALAAINPLLSFIGRLGDGNGIGTYAETLFKALGIALVCEICANICRESGESGIAGGVELVGKIEILLLCVPLMERVLDTAKVLLEMGG